MPRGKRPGAIPEDVVLPIFEEPEPEVVRPKSAKQVEKDAKLGYRKFSSSTQRVSCDHCVKEKIAGERPGIHTASYIRTLGDDITYLCYYHTQAYKHRDGVT